MLKKALASIWMLTILSTFTMTVNAQESDTYNMWECILLTPDYTQLPTLQKNMREHNAKYHSEGPFNATVYNIASGPNAGKMVWQMGPMMMKHNDERPAEGGHDADWNTKVMPYIKKMHTIEYWTQDDEKSNTALLAGPEVKYPILFIRYFEINSDNDFLVNQHFEEISKTIKALEGDNPWGLYYNEFIQGDLGRHIAGVNFYKNWAEMDEDRKFKETHGKLFGENAWDVFIDRADAVFSNRWDEIWVYNKDMSGD